MTTSSYLNVGEKM